MADVTIKVRGITHIIDVEEGTTKEMVTEAFNKLYPSENNIESTIEYTVLSRHVTPEAIEEFKRKMSESIKRDALTRGLK